MDPGALERVKKVYVIPSQCSHWRGNPLNKSENHRKMV